MDTNTENRCPVIGGSGTMGYMHPHQGFFYVPHLFFARGYKGVHSWTVVQAYPIPQPVLSNSASYNTLQ